jgi:Bacterial mobilisation protein (MobC)
MAIATNGTPGGAHGRRRRANAPGGRSHAHLVRVTSAEGQRLRSLAERQRVSVPRLLVESALAEAGETTTERRDAIAELFRLRRSLIGVATNVNQLAKHANATGTFPSDADAVLPRVREMCVRIDGVIDRLSGP